METDTTGWECAVVEEASRQFVRASRGKRSQMSLSRRLGFRANVVAHWESGRSFPTAAVMLQACQIRRIDVHGAFRRFDERSVGLLETLSDDALAAWLRNQQGATPVGELARRSGLSRFAVSRILAGKTKVRLPDFFRLVETMTKRLTALVADLVDIDTVPALHDLHHPRVSPATLAREHPLSTPVLLSLGTVEYRRLPMHDPGCIADMLCTATEEVVRCLALLEGAAVIERRGNHYEALCVMRAERACSPRAGRPTLQRQGANPVQETQEREAS